VGGVGVLGKMKAVPGSLLLSFSLSLSLLPISCET
jgi:hypothetical protein